jgi:hypothetical protein
MSNSFKLGNGFRFSRKSVVPSNRFKGWRRIFDESGSALVEMGLSAAILFGMFFGVFEVTMASYSYHYVSDAAREGARWAIVRGDSCSHNTQGLDHCGASSDDIQAYIRGLGYPGINPSNLTATSTWWSPPTINGGAWTSCSSAGCKAPGNMVKVYVVYAFPFNVPFVPSQTINVQSVSRMIIAQ